MQLVIPFLNCTNQSIKAFECAVYHLQYLLSNVSVQQLIVLVNFTLVVVRLVTQVFTFLKEVLTNCVKPYVVKVFTQSAQLPQSQEFGLIKFSHLVLLGQVHNHCFATCFIIQRNGRIYPASRFPPLAKAQGFPARFIV